MKNGTPSPAPTARAVAAETAPALTTDEEDTQVDSATGDPKQATPETTEVPVRKIAFNPSAGEVHRREQGAPWRVDAEEQIRQTNARAREEQAEKRRWGLAKQVQDGLVHSYGVNYGIAELAALLKDGIAIRARGSSELSPSEVFLCPTSCRCGEI
ncbi:hypothetical protein PINS_up022663 [Pythium insidiosum]|nr:hypothetical protein PINS_up022663 [Pythium insidiosum]